MITSSAFVESQVRRAPMCNNCSGSSIQIFCVARTSSNICNRRVRVSFTLVGPRSDRKRNVSASSVVKGSSIRRRPMGLVRVLSRFAVVLFGTVGSAHAQSEFLANLSGTNEVPAVATGGFGSAVLDVNVAGGTVGITFELTGVNLTDAFMGHIH